MSLRIERSVRTVNSRDVPQLLGLPVHDLELHGRLSAIRADRGDAGDEGVGHDHRAAPRQGILEAEEPFAAGRRRDRHAFLAGGDEPGGIVQDGDLAGAVLRRVSAFSTP